MGRLTRVAIDWIGSLWLCRVLRCPGCLTVMIYWWLLGGKLAHRSLLLGCSCLLLGRSR